MLYSSIQMRTEVFICDRVKQEGKLTTRNRGKVEVLNNYLSSIFTEENLDNMPSLVPRTNDAPLITRKITPDKVKKKLLELKKTLVIITLKICLTTNAKTSIVYPFFAQMIRKLFE